MVLVSLEWPRLFEKAAEKYTLFCKFHFIARVIIVARGTGNTFQGNIQDEFNERGKYLKHGVCTQANSTKHSNKHTHVLIRLTSRKNPWGQPRDRAYSKYCMRALQPVCHVLHNSFCETFFCTTNETTYLQKQKTNNKKQCYIINPVLRINAP